MEGHSQHLALEFRDAVHQLQELENGALDRSLLEGDEDHLDRSRRPSCRRAGMKRLSSMSLACYKFATWKLFIFLTI